MLAILCQINCKFHEKMLENVRKQVEGDFTVHVNICVLTHI